MRRVQLSRAAVRQYGRLTARLRASLRDVLAERLAKEDATIEDRNGFRLRRASPHADFELRHGVVRVFYRVEGDMVLVELIGRKEGNRLRIEGQEFDL